MTYFGAKKPLDAISPGDADDFRRNLATRLGDNTVRRQCGRAKQFFKAAVRKRLIVENPFGDMKGCGVQANRARDHFVTRKEAAQVLKACPDVQWRLLFALSRFGGLRCPSEHLALRWGDLDWERGRMTIRSPKTEHHEGKESRVIPIFPELRPYLEEAFDVADEGTEFVITRYRDTNANLRTQLLRIIERAGLTPWPKLFQNLRASRETELAEVYPLHVVCAWIGNSTAVAAKHYLQVTDEHFEAAQNAAQHLRAAGGFESQSVNHPPGKAHEKTPEMKGFANNCSNVLSACTDVQVPPDGAEHPAPNPGKTAELKEGGAKCGALGPVEAQIDMELGSIVEAWPRLPEAIKSAILALVRAGSSEQGRR